MGPAARGGVCERARRVTESKPAYTDDDFLELQRLDLESRGVLCSLLSLHGGEHLTVCPRCGLDHFVHEDDCPLALQEGAEGYWARGEAETDESD